MKWLMKYWQRDETIQHDPIRLIINVNDSIIHNLQRARDRMMHHKYIRSSIDMNKAQYTLSKLLLALNENDGDRFYTNLSRVYAYFKKQLYDARQFNDTEKISFVIQHMIKLRNVWDQMSYP
jgi:flagellar biosynthetic protein FliS